MRFKGVRKIHSGGYITRYDLMYETESGSSKVYEMISRDSNIDSFERLRSGKADAVVMIIRSTDGKKLLLNHEFRMATGEWVYNFPAGLIDSGETPEQAAARELCEETGLTLVSIDRVWKECYSAVGFSNEKTIVIEGTAEGEILPSDSDAEEIEAGWFTRKEVQTLLSNEYFAARTQTYCVLWSEG